MLIQLGEEFNSSKFPSASKRCQAIKTHGSAIIDQLEYINGILYYKQILGAEYPYNKKFKRKGLSQSYREVVKKFTFPT